MASPVGVFGGQQGRKPASLPAKELLHRLNLLEEKTLEQFEKEHLDESADKENPETTNESSNKTPIVALPQGTIDSITSKVNEILESLDGGFRFDQEYMDAHGGAYGVPTIVLDINHNVHLYTTHLFKPNADSCHVIFRTGAEVRKVIRLVEGPNAPLTFVDMYFGKFKNKECIFIAPSTMHCVALYRALNLETVDGTIALMEVRMADKYLAGKTQPRLCVGKFKFLFGREPDLSAYNATKEAKRQARSEAKKETNGDNEKPRSKKRTYEISHESLLAELQSLLRTGSLGYDHAISYEARCKLSQFATDFLSALYTCMSDKDAFVDYFAPLTKLHRNALLSLLGSREASMVHINTLIKEDDHSYQALTDFVENYNPEFA